MNHPLLGELEDTLALEEIDVLQLGKTRLARQLASRRRKLWALVREATRLRNVTLILAAELAIVRGDLVRYTNSRRMRGSLTRALEELQAIQTHLGYVTDKAIYAVIDRAHSLPKKRLNGLPRDDARMALASHISRLGNMDKSRLGEEEKEVLNARLVAVRTLEELYIALQEACRLRQNKTACGCIAD